MDIIAIIASSIPVGLILAAIIRITAARRARWRIPGAEGPPDYRHRGGPGSVREPRHPLSPAGAGSAAVALPEEDDDLLEAVMAETMRWAAKSWSLEPERRAG